MNAIYAGTFDPFTNGHMDVLEQALTVFDKVFLLVCDNPNKKTMFTLDQRELMLLSTFGYTPNVYTVANKHEATVDIAERYNINHLIRGIRTVSDFEYELQIADMNKRLNKNIHTIYFTPSFENQFISSSMVREFIRLNKDYSKLVPRSIQLAIKGLK